MRAVSPQFHPLLTVLRQNSLLVLLNQRLQVTAQSMHRGVTAKQRRQ
jgi:hypothetical protein